MILTNYSNIKLILYDLLSIDFLINNSDVVYLRLCTYTFGIYCVDIICIVISAIIDNELCSVDVVTIEMMILFAIIAARPVAIYIYIIVVSLY